MQFKIIFSVPYQVLDIYNDNLDLNIVLENGEVYFWDTVYFEKYQASYGGRYGYIFLVDRYAYSERLVL